MKDKKLFIIGGAAFFLFILIIAISISVSSQKKKQELPCYNQTIIVWSPFKNYKYPEVSNELKKYCLKIKVVEKSIDEIRNSLFSEISAGNIPDVVYVDSEFLIDNIKIFSQYKGKNINLDDYPDIISKIFNNKILAYPVTYDPLVLFWNKDLLYSAGYIEPPKTFEDMQNLIKQVRILEFDKIKTSPIALGTANNIKPFSKIFLVFHKLLNRDYQLPPSFYKTLDFYTQFANKDSEYYSWNPNMDDQLEEFSNGNVAMIIDFYSKKNDILKKNNRLNFDIALLPKFKDNPRSLNYFYGYFFAVPKQGKTKFAWMFIESLDKKYEKFVKSVNLIPAKKSFYDKLDKEGKIVFQSILNSDMFLEFNKKYLEDALKKDIEDWIYRKEDIKRLLQSQIYNFFKK
ncbi:MAG: ABC transporter substrate-binding protein [Minisyncoccia bacterium]